MDADRLSTALGGRKTGTGWMAPCPAHDDRKPSLSISNGDHGKPLIYCHAGCDQADVIRALQALGLWQTPGGERPRTPHPKPRGRLNKEPSHNDHDRTRSALIIWNNSIPILGSSATSYMKYRGIHINLPATLRYHPGLPHSTGTQWPAMVAMVTNGTDDAPLAIHRTFLAHDGSSKAAIHPQKMMLGPCRGGAVRLGPPGPVLMIGEGIETCLSASQATGLPSWAALSTSGLRSLDLPDAVREVIVLADGDDAGKTAARDAALRWQREGRRVRIARPPAGADFNDLLLGRIPSVAEVTP